MKSELDTLTDHFVYLAMLRKSSRVNMWGAPAYLTRDQGLDEAEAMRVFGLWQDVFDGDDTLSGIRAQAERALGVPA